MARAAAYQLGRCKFGTERPDPMMDDVHQVSAVRAGHGQLTADARPGLQAVVRYGSVQVGHAVLRGTV